MQFWRRHDLANSTISQAKAIRIPVELCVIQGITHRSSRFSKMYCRATTNFQIMPTFELLERHFS